MVFYDANIDYIEQAALLFMVPGRFARELFRP